MLPPEILAQLAPTPADPRPVLLTIAGLGLGGAEPIASNDQEATRRLNRRVEFRIVGLQ